MRDDDFAVVHDCVAHALKTGGTRVSGLMMVVDELGDDVRTEEMVSTFLELWDDMEDTYRA